MIISSSRFPLVFPESLKARLGKIFLIETDLRLKFLSAQLKSHFSEALAFFFLPEKARKFCEKRFEKHS
jgi:hypothetical protein